MTTGTNFYVGKGRAWSSQKPRAQLVLAWGGIGTKERTQELSSNCRGKEPMCLDGATCEEFKKLDKEKRMQTR